MFNRDTHLICALVMALLLPAGAAAGADKPGDTSGKKPAENAEGIPEAKRKEIAEGVAVIEELDVASLRAFTKNLHRRVSKLDADEDAAVPQRLREARKRLAALKKELEALKQRYAALQKEHKELGGGKDEKTQKKAKTE